MGLVSRFLYLFEEGGRRKAWLILFLMLGGALLEGVGVGIILPFIGIVTDPGMLQRNRVLNVIYEALGHPSYSRFLFWACLLLLAVYVLKNLFLVVMYYLNNRYVYYQYAALADRLLNAYLRAPYTFHLQRNSAELLKNILIEASQVFGQVLVPIFTIMIEGLVALVLVIVLFAAEPVSALASLGLLGMLTAVLYSRTKNLMTELGLRQQQNYRGMFQWVNQGLGGAKEAKVLGRESFFLEAFSKNSESFAGAVSRYQASLQYPRLVIETIAVTGVLLIVMVMLAQHRKPQELLPIIAVFAMASFRLMPSLSRVINAVQTIRFNTPSIDVVYKDLMLLEGPQAVGRVQKIASDKTPRRAFRQSIVLKDVTYRYPGAVEPALKRISMTIPRGASVAITGPSGAGKTTLADVILGLLLPESGEIFVDGNNIHDDLAQWQSRIGYVPQTTFLCDDTIRRNIAFGLKDSEIDEERVRNAVELSQLREFIEALPQGLDAPIGERGVRISGGQRQRLGIARAVYHGPEILVMDEATSSLDDATESEVNKAIERLRGEKTLIIIAHRASTIKNCTALVRIDGGGGQ